MFHGSLDGLSGPTRMTCALLDRMTPRCRLSTTLDTQTNPRFAFPHHAGLSSRLHGPRSHDVVYRIPQTTS
ncbi:hypothetical protein RSAG8_05637, partial [Rhizoctonia solani AG-8 WAC10335]